MLTPVLLTALFAGVPAEAQPAAAPPAYASTTIDIGVVVSDLEKSLKFYRDDLGFQPNNPPSFDVPAELARDAGLNEGQPVHVEMLRLGEGEPATRLKLLGVPNAKKGDQSLVTRGLGARYLTLVVKDLGAVLERLKERSIPLAGKGAVRLSGSTAIAFVQDPDGNFVEFVGTLKEDSAAGFRPLFNGKDLQGWRPLKNAVWKVSDRMIVGEQGPESAGGWLATEKTYGDFELRYKFRITKGANTGIGFRFPARDDVSPAKTGYECQISETDPQYHTGSIFGIKKAPEGLIREGEWCEGRIVARGPKISTFVNGKEAVSIEDSRSARGAIGLQVHGTALYKGMKVEFKDLEIREE